MIRSNAGSATRGLVEAHQRGQYSGRDPIQVSLPEETVMPINVTSTLRRALRQLETERSHIDRQITALRNALDGLGSPPSRGRRSHPFKPTRRPRRMTATARRALSRRMNLYWAKRRTAKGKRRKPA